MARNSSKRNYVFSGSEKPNKNAHVHRFPRSKMSIGGKRKRSQTSPDIARETKKIRRILQGIADRHSVIRNCPNDEFPPALSRLGWGSNSTCSETRRRCLHTKKLTRTNNQIELNSYSADHPTPIATPQNLLIDNDDQCVRKNVRESYKDHIESHHGDCVVDHDDETINCDTATPRNQRTDGACAPIGLTTTDEIDSCHGGEDIQTVTEFDGSHNLSATPCGSDSNALGQDIGSASNALGQDISMDADMDDKSLRDISEVAEVDEVLNNFDESDGLACHGIAEDADQDNVNIEPCRSLNIRITPLNDSERLRLNIHIQELMKDMSGLKGSDWVIDEVLNKMMSIINEWNEAYNKIFGNNESEQPEFMETSIDHCQTGNDNVIESEGTEKESEVEDGNKVYILFQQPRPRCYAFNSFFYTRLTKSGYDYSGVSRWLKKANKSVSEMDLILVPVHVDSVHWFLTAIDIRNRRFIYYDSFRDPPKESTVAYIKKWLEDEIRSERGEQGVQHLELSKWTMFINPNFLPQQTDFSSCVMFAFYIAEYLERGILPDFGQSDVKVMRERTALFILDGQIPDDDAHGP